MGTRSSSQLFPPRLSDTGKVIVSTQIRERTREDVLRGHLTVLLSSSLTSWLLVLNMLFLFPFPPHPTNRLSRDRLGPGTHTVLPSPKPKHVCVISKFHQLAREKHDIYRPRAPGSSDHASEFLMRNRLVPLEINI